MPDPSQTPLCAQLYPQHPYRLPTPADIGLDCALSGLGGGQAGPRWLLFIDLRDPAGARQPTCRARQRLLTGDTQRHGWCKCSSPSVTPLSRPFIPTAPRKRGRRHGKVVPAGRHRQPKLATPRSRCHLDGLEVSRRCCRRSSGDIDWAEEAVGRAEARLPIATWTSPGA